jgi:hypothetical protein
MLRTWACGGSLIYFNFLFLVFHLLNHVGMWDLLLVPNWWENKNNKNNIYIYIYNHSPQPKLS